MIRVVAPESFALLLVSQIGIAIAQPFVLNGVTKLATTWFAPGEEALAVGLGSFALFIGMLVALGLTPQLVQGIGFNGMLQIYGILGIIGTIIFLAFVKSRPPTPPRMAEETEATAGWRSIGEILKVKDFMILGFIALIGIGVFNGLATWIEKILNELHGIPMADAGTISAALVVAGMIGCIVLPLISDKVRSRKPFLISATLIGMVTVLLIIFIRGYIPNLINGIAIGFFFISALPIMLTMSAEITGPRFAGISVGYLQLLGNLAAVILVAVMETIRSATSNFIVPIILLILNIYPRMPDSQYQCQ